MVELVPPHTEQRSRRKPPLGCPPSEQSRTPSSGRVCGVRGFGFGLQILGFEVENLEFGVENTGLGFGVLGLESGVETFGLGFQF